MKKYFILVAISFLYFNTKVKAVDYAILISAGETTQENIFNNSEYWYDLFLAYEDLVLKEGYDPANVFVFYGNGTSYSPPSYPPYNRFSTSYHNWGNIVDFDNAYSTLDTQFANIGALITNNDNLLIRWVVGHGWGNSATTATTPFSAPTKYSPGINNDDYWVLLENRGLFIRETEIIRIINQIPNYKRRKILWMTCLSGCLTSGANNLNNDKTVLITSSSWDKPSPPYPLTYSLQPQITIQHAAFNYVITSVLYGQDPTGQPPICTDDPDSNGDGVLNMWELWNEADQNCILTSDPQLGDNGSLANRVYIDEGLQFNDVTLPNTIEYRVANFNTNNTTIQNNSNVTIVIDQGFNATGTFIAPLGTTLNIRP
jgi:hypothetical protein